jgi:hypothetical protein
VTPASFISFFPLLLGLFVADPGGIPVTVSRLVIQDEVILRVPVQPRPIAPQFDWIEKKGPKCIPAAAIRRSSLSGPEQVDLILSGGSRVRAKFDEDCHALDFYGGFYLQYGRDEQICVHRDAVMSRVGERCMIERFRILIPKFKH